MCRRGSAAPVRCPALASCPEGTESPLDSWIGLAADCVLFATLALLWQASRLYARVMRRLGARERVRVMWRQMRPQITVVEVAEERVWRSSGGGGGGGTGTGTAGQPAAGWRRSGTFTAAAVDAGGAAAGSADGDRSNEQPAGRCSFALALAQPTRLLSMGLLAWPAGRHGTRRRSRTAHHPIWASVDGHSLPLLTMAQHDGGEVCACHAWCTYMDTLAVQHIG